MQNNTLESQEKLYQLASLQEQIKSFRTEFEGVKSRIGKIDTLVSIRPITESGGMINLINNGDFTFNDAGYNSASYVDSAEYAADWYQKTQGTAAWLLTPLPAGAVSTQALKNDNTLNTFWDKAAGTANVGGGRILGQKLAKKYLSAGNKVYVRFQIAKKVGSTINADIKIKVSIYDNTTGSEKVIEGSTLILNSTVQGTAGARTRKYILEVITASGSFYSDITSAGTGQVATARDIGTGDPTLDYVNVSWSAIVEQQAYRLYRQASDDLTWRLLTEITNGGTSFRDTGNTPLITFTPPVTQNNPKAEAYILAAGASLTESLQETLMSIRIPSTYNFSTTTEQWLQIEFQKSDGTNSTITEIPIGGILLDKVGLSLANGRWLPSTKDQQSLAVIQTTVPPTSGGGTGEYIPPEGGGEIGCVVPNALVMSVNSATRAVEQILASRVYVGMTLIGKDRHGLMGESKVKRIWKGRTKKVYNVITDLGFCLPCSPTHPIIQTVEDFKGITAHELDRIQLDDLIEILVSPTGEFFFQDYLTAVEVIEHDTEVIGFEMEDSTMTFIANNIVSHNLEQKFYYQQY